MNILYIEPYLGKSHLAWFEGLRQHSKYNFDILDLPGSKWKWRMHGGAITIANMFNQLNSNYDLIICSDFLNLPIFKSLCHDKIGRTPILVYFHENQASYPWSPADKDIELKRDFHYYFINQTTSLCSSWNYFNSMYHLESYIEGLSRYLSKMPDYKNKETLNLIKSKSSVLHLGCDLKKLGEARNEAENRKPLILWNHRWEYDKNPELFFETMIEIKNRGLDFELVLLGERFASYPEIFTKAIEVLKDNIITHEYCTFEEYKNWLWKADILPVTSIQDFFGISVMEAIYCNTYPILPNRLSYLELYNNNLNKNLFYNNNKEFLDKLTYAIKNHKKLPKYSKITDKYRWDKIISKYDLEFQKQCES